MSSNGSREGIFLLVGDIVAYIFSLIVTLTVRYGALPGRGLLLIHLQSFLVLFVVFVLVNLGAGLYDAQASFRRSRAVSAVITAQAVNAVLGIAYFYFIPAAIAPKFNLFLFFIASTLALLVWRAVMFPVISAEKRRTALLIGAGPEIDDLAAEVKIDARYGLCFAERAAPQASKEAMEQAIAAAVKRTGATAIVADLNDHAVEQAMPILYSLVFSGLSIMDAGRLYESVFGRVPLSLAGERWLVENSSAALGNRRTYDILKRAMDITAGAILGLISLVFYPFVWAAIKLDDGGPLFVAQTRVGQGNKPISMLKFRSMTADDGGAYGANGGRTGLRITRVGRIIRLTRIDELPQLWSVLRGDQSLIGPRPELPALASLYEKEIPYYNARHLIKPGLSGWAQIYHKAHPHHAVAVGDTRDKLSYDLYYVKNRSLFLDVKIALQTLRALVSRQGV